VPIQQPRALGEYLISAADRLRAAVAKPGHEMSDPARDPRPSNGADFCGLPTPLATATSSVIEAGNQFRPALDDEGRRPRGSVTTTLAWGLPHLGGSCVRPTVHGGGGVVGAQDDAPRPMRYANPTPSRSWPGTESDESTHRSTSTRKGLRSGGHLPGSY